MYDICASPQEWPMPGMLPAGLPPHYAPKGRGNRRPNRMPNPGMLSEGISLNLAIFKLNEFLSLSQTNWGNHILLFLLCQRQPNVA
jgi:hypothetical protein